MCAIELKTPPELAKMRVAGRFAAETLRLVRDIAEPGITTEHLDKTAADYIAEQGAEAAFKGYRGFPASICTSLNEEIVHGIPGPRQLQEGDLLKVDIGVIWQGYYGDAALTVPVGEVSDVARDLLNVTREALDIGITAMKPGMRLSMLSSSIQNYVEEHGFSVVREYTGHGIGKALHEDPQVPNFVPWRLGHRDPELRPGTVLAIEPMVNIGTHKTKVLENGWTVVTRDGELSAHFEHTVALSESGPVIMTVP